MPDFSITGDTVIKGEIFYEKEVIHGLKIMMLFIPHTFTHYACIPTHPFPSSPNSQQRAFMTNSFTNCGLYTSFPTIKSNKCSCVLYIKKLTNANKTILAVNKMITFLFLLLFSFNQIISLEPFHLLVCYRVETKPQKRKANIHQQHFWYMRGTTREKNYYLLQFEYYVPLESPCGGKSLVPCAALWMMAEVLNT